MRHWAAENRSMKCCASSGTLAGLAVAIALAVCSTNLGATESSAASLPEDVAVRNATTDQATLAQARSTAEAGTAACPPPVPKPPAKPQPVRSSCCPQQIVYCGSPGGNDAVANGKDDRTVKAVEQALTSVKQSAELAIDAARTSNETVKWVYIVQSALATLVGIVLASIGGVLGFFGIRSLRDFQRFQFRARKQRELIRRRFLEESKRMQYWGELNTQFAAASGPLATLSSIHDEEIREEMRRVKHDVTPDELAQAQRESRKLHALENAMRAIHRLKELAAKAEHARFLSWAEGAEATANYNAGNLDAALQLAKRAKADNPMNHPDRAYVLGFVYARLYYRKKDADLREAAVREFREAFSLDTSGAFVALAQADKELELYLGKETISELTKATPPAAGR